MAVPLRARLAAAVLALVVVPLTGCAPQDRQPVGRDELDFSVGGEPDAPITLGADNSAESRVVAALYRQLLLAAGKQVRQTTTGYATPAEAARAVVTRAVTLAPMYETTFLRSIPGSKHIPGDLPASLNLALPAGVVALPPAEAQRGVVIAITRATADRYGWQSLADPAASGRALTLGGPAAGNPDAPSPAALTRAYGLRLGAASGPPDLLLLRATDPAIARDDLTVLGDPRQVLPRDRVFPLLDAGYADAAVRTALAGLRTPLTTEVLAELAVAVGAGEAPDEVAAEWLRSAKLIR